jgi:hypothetical protein
MQDCPKLAMANFRWIGPCHFGLLVAMKVQRRPGATLEMASQKLAMANFDANQGLRRLDFGDSMKAPKRTRALAWFGRPTFGAPSVKRPDSQDCPKLAIANFGVNRAVRPRACRLNQGSGAVAQATRPSLLSRRSGTRVRISGGCMYRSGRGLGHRESWQWPTAIEIALQHLDSAAPRFPVLVSRTCVGGYVLDGDGKGGPLSGVGGPNCTRIPRSWPWPTFRESGGRPTLQYGRCSMQEDAPWSARRLSPGCSLSNLGSGRVG